MTRGNPVALPVFEGISMRFAAPVLVLLLGCATASSGSGAPVPGTSSPGRTASLQLPRVSWSSEEQAVHVLDRLAYGPSPADLHQIEAMGPAAWIGWQLRPGDIDDATVEKRLADFPSLAMSTRELVAHYPRVKKVAEAKGISLEGKSPEALRAELAGVVEPFQLPRQVGAELIAARLIRATESRRQLQEQLVDFWFNHFNVSADKGAIRWMVSPYEREAIRPKIFGSFRNLLGAVAHHPAMLFYLDNWASTREGFSGPKRGRLGLNENYARELLELHTLGVDGGYTQEDVREVARCFTGWGIRKPNEDGSFEFHPMAHDRGSKRALGTEIPAGGGMEDGERVLDLLAVHPSTARFIARKLAQKFVMDSPPPALVERVAQVFLRTGGDLTATYRAVFESPEFWSDAARGSKVKTPLEFTVSAVRVLGGTTAGDVPMVQALNRMGQPLYRAQPPTGWPEVSQPWVNPGALVARIDFGLKLAAGRLTGTGVPLPAVDGPPEEVVDRTARAILHRRLGEQTRATVLAALGASEVMPDGERRRIDGAKLVGLLLGAPE
ncbi:MAG TPA: DUF1800 domain-containing protein, partial [Myxococcaceae bacterium]|nr:DUF1800 domain-containing protein [Myxococcaceae bacterium]